MQARAMHARPHGIRVDAPKALNFANASTEWAEWIKRFNRYRSVSGLIHQPQGTQVDTLVYIMGHEAEDVYAQLTIPNQNNVFDDSNTEVTFEDAEKAFTDYFQPRTNKRHHRNLFYNRKQKEGEAAEEYIRDIHQLANKCKFGAVQDEMMIDRLLSGMQDTHLSTELQMDEDVKLETVTQKMRTKEAITKQLKLESSVASVTQHRPQRKGQPWWKRKGDRGKDSSETQKQTNKKQCIYCGQSCEPKKCPAFGKTCNRCKRRNHFTSMCQAKQNSSTKVDEVAQYENAELNDDFMITVINVDDVKPSNAMSIWIIDIAINNQLVQAKADTGAQVNVISLSELARVMPNYAKAMKPASSKLVSYTGHQLSIMGVIELTCWFKQVSYNLLFYVMKDDSTKTQTLISLPTLQSMGLLNQISSLENAQVADEFSHLFTGLGKLKTKHKITVDKDSSPYASSARSVPFAIRPKLKAELERLENLGVITKCDEATPWVHQTVNVLKPDGSVRICLDPQRLNASIVRERIKLPTVAEIYARLSGSTVFTNLDATSGFHQIPLDEESSMLTTFITVFGRYRYLRLPFEISSAPEVFHKTIAELVGDLKGVEVYIYDILVHAPDQKAHDELLP